ncbi:CU044_2847 family protein [Insolitispirillum peregrinum]|uniref:Trypsin-co-occurring domain-containing protein n=1 Tax=Insolitispirillum peregrinum TaxID=80876 RepID=A0A1N7PAV8_9PROT|nr:CU044_2847 family protein [Insolitispirillum peregrinum]SIT07680.1 hypothetical protein SAMN05421779_106192 [Insolitispirillum peregrinum]
MPIRLVPYDLPNGQQIIVEEEVADRGGMVANTGSGLAAKARQSFDQALAAIRPSLASVMDQVDSLATRPEQVTVELGFTLKGEVGAVIAKSAAEANIKISLTWKPAKP